MKATIEQGPTSVVVRLDPETSDEQELLRRFEEIRMSDKPHSVHGGITPSGRLDLAAAYVADMLNRRHRWAA